MKALLSVATLALAATATFADETMRCGKWVIDSEITVPELLEKCGEPTSKHVSDQPVYVRNPAGRVVRVGTSTVEIWIYDRGPQSFRMLVTIADGKIKEIDHER